MSLIIKIGPIVSQLDIALILHALVYLLVAHTHMEAGYTDMSQI